MEGLQLTKNLYLTDVHENHFSGVDLLAVVCFFEFFGEEGLAYISLNRIEEEHPSYGMIDMAEELHESFVDLLEEDQIWKKIVSKVKEFHQEWNEYQEAED